MKLLFFSLLLTTLVYTQSYKVEKITGTVKSMQGNSETWTDVKEGSFLQGNTMIMTDKSSTILLSGGGIKFSLKPSAIINVSNIKKITIDELLLALATEEILNAPAKNKKGNVSNTEIYGEEYDNKNSSSHQSQFGLYRLNGAKQLAESGFEGTAIVAARETFRKYPATASMADYRIYFANLLFSMNLNEEAYQEFESISRLKLSEQQSATVKSRINDLKKRLSGM